MLSRRQVLLRRKLTYWLTSHPWMKLISLVLAVLLWFYVRGEINRFNY